MFGQSPLAMFVQSVKYVPDPRSKRGVSQPFRIVLTITILGLLANLSAFAEFLTRFCNRKPLLPGGRQSRQTDER